MENRRRLENVNNHSSDSNAYEQYRRRQQSELWEKANDGWTPNHPDPEKSAPKEKLLDGGYIEQVNAFDKNERHKLRFAINNPEELDKDPVKYVRHYQLHQYYNAAKELEARGEGNVNVDLIPTYEQKHFNAAKDVFRSIITENNAKEVREIYGRIIAMGKTYKNHDSGYKCHNVLNQIKNEGGDIAKQIVEAVQASYDAEGS